jgi:hypothetical protein
MSLWNKPVSEITFADVDFFCRTQQPEGARLDYKVEVDDSPKFGAWMPTYLLGRPGLMAASCVRVLATSLTGEWLPLVKESAR